MDLLHLRVVRNDSEFFLYFTPSDTVANSATGLEAWEGYEGHRAGRAESKTLRSEAQPGGKRNCVRVCGQRKVEGRK